jgi:acyl carrier protein
MHMDRSEALTALRTAAVDVLQVEADKVTEAASFAEDLEADSLDLVELVMSLEDTLGITIEEDELAEVKTVGDALDVILAASVASKA